MSADDEVQYKFDHTSLLDDCPVSKSTLLFARVAAWWFGSTKAAMESQRHLDEFSEHLFWMCEALMWNRKGFDIQDVADCAESMGAFYFKDQGMHRIAVFPEALCHALGCPDKWDDVKKELKALGYIIFEQDNHAWCLFRMTWFFNDAKYYNMMAFLVPCDALAERLTESEMVSILV
jgi:hypothetical protein